MEKDEFMSLEEYKKYLSDRYFKDDLKYKMEQVGYPDCLHYEKKDGKKVGIPLMLSHDFNAEGEIVHTHVYARNQRSASGGAVVF